MTEKKIKELVIKGIAIMYMIALTVFISEYILNVFETQLWENESFAMRSYIVIGMLVSLVYFSMKENNIFKLMFAYHFILIGTAVCVIIPFKFMLFVLIPMVITAIYDIKAGLVATTSVSVTVMLGMGIYPMYFWGVAFIMILATSCFCVGKFDALWKNIFGKLIFICSELFLLIFFKKYCEDLEYAHIEEVKYGRDFLSDVIDKKNKFIITIIIISVICMIFANVIKIFADKIIYKRTPAIIINKLTSSNSEIVQLMKKKSASLYYHSNEVAEMSRLAAKRIGADYNLAYAGGLFHDLGKVAGSEYIKEGLKLAEQYGIPKDVRTIMVEHNVKSRTPKSKEAAIVMLSDTVVSTIEYVKGTMDKKDISEQVLVENAINKRLTSGALNKSGLTIEEFNIIKETLVNIKEQQ